jgi:hypothetical protein
MCLPFLANLISELKNMLSANQIRKLHRRNWSRLVERLLGQVSVVSPLKCLARLAIAPPVSLKNILSWEKA